MSTLAHTLHEGLSRLRQAHRRSLGTVYVVVGSVLFAVLLACYGFLREGVHDTQTVLSASATVATIALLTGAAWIVLLRRRYEKLCTSEMGGSVVVTDA